MWHRHHHHHHRHRHRGRFRWVLAQGIHSTVLSVVTVALAVGVAGGALVHAALGAGVAPPGLACAALGGLALLWPLSWAATFRIMRPLRTLATVAGDLEDGKLGSRAELPDAPGEVGDVAQALGRLAERLTAQLEEQRALMAAVSHELRSPLGRVRVLVEMAREGSAPPTLHDDLEAEIEGMDALVGDLLAATRIELEAVSPRDLDPVDLARRALELSRTTAALTADAAAGRVNADATLLARAVAGLLDNAKRYGGERIELRVSSADERVRFEVRDDGPGFAPGDEERAFEPFWRGPVADGRPAPRGEGLGLALVRKIAEAHGGTASATNGPDGGARVWIELPRV